MTPLAELRFGSICSGIEAASAAWLPLGFECSFMSEIEPSARAVLQHHGVDWAEDRGAFRLKPALGFDKPL